LPAFHNVFRLRSLGCGYISNLVRTVISKLVLKPYSLAFNAASAKIDPNCRCLGEIAADTKESYAYPKGGYPRQSSSANGCRLWPAWGSCVRRTRTRTGLVVARQSPRQGAGLCRVSPSQGPRVLSVRIWAPAMAALYSSRCGLQQCHNRLTMRMGQRP
jgi:hypothetical protein